MSKNHFKEENQRNIQVLKSSELIGFWDDFQYYESKIVEEEKTIFVKTLLRGEISLYAEGKNFYIEKNKEFYLLTKKDKEVEGGIRQDKKYIGIAKFLFFDCLKKSNQEWSRLRFSKKSFVSLVTQYNKCKYPSKNIEDFTAHQKNLKKGVYIEGMSTTISDFARLNSKLGFKIGGFTKISNKKFTEFQIGLQLSVQNGERKYNSTLSEGTVNYSLGILEVPVMIQKRVIRTNSNNGIFINTGVNFGLSIFKNTKAKFTNPDLVNFVNDRIEGSAIIGGRVGIGYLHRLANSDLAISYFFERSTFGLGTNIQNQGVRVAHIF